MKLYTPEMSGSGQTGKCAHCGKLPILDNTEGNEHEVYDGCLGKLTGDVMNACCGHGDTSLAYIQKWDGSCIRGDEAIVKFKELKGD